ncbi:helix-turn-helix domain-containing protein [Brevibacterium album]|uniref:helix-turn-helix domain-containing protein n=1 Tax=Brevibacterium album TaxID=417948 RepID=UPI0003FC4B5E|nr:XRE family transcriptional regulator [Brevibacterium album]
MGPAPESADTAYRSGGTAEALPAGTAHCVAAGVPDASGGEAAGAAAPMSRLAAALRRERERMGLSLSETAKRAGVGKSTLSQLENGNGNPSIETLWALATALGVQLSRLIAPAREPLSVIRLGEGIALPSSASEYSATLLTACPPGARRDVFQIRMEPGAPREAQPHPPGTVEHLIVCAGSLTLTADGDTVTLFAGDYARHAGDVPHTYSTAEPGTVMLTIVESQ